MRSSDFQDVFLDTTDSTNRVARELGEQGAAHGIGVLAACQTAGRGRLGRRWYSPSGKNLYCSYIVRPNIDLHHFPKLTMTAGVAAAECLHDVYKIEIGLKWPNDLYIGSKKCGGILSEFTEDHYGNTFAVIGIGINCNQKSSDFSAEIKDIATSLLIAGAENLEVTELFQAIKSSLLSTIKDFESKGFSEVLKRWQDYDLFRGSNMVWLTPDGRRVEGENLGPDTDGMLRVKDTEGTIHLVLTGDVNLNNPQ